METDIVTRLKKHGQAFLNRLYRLRDIGQFDFGQIDLARAMDYFRLLVNHKMSVVYVLVLVMCGLLLFSGAVQQHTETRLFNQPETSRFDVAKLHEACRRLQKTIPPPKHTASVKQIYTVNKHSTVVCVIPKAGCTFIKQLVYYLNEPEELARSPELLGSGKNLSERLDYVRYHQEHVFNMSRQNIHHRLDFEPVKITPEMLALTDASLKVVMTRNPYTRIYSAYIDKIFIPLNWEYTAMKYAQRNNIPVSNSTGSLVCNAKYVTFENFIEYITEDSLNWSDEHWTPATALCDPCTVTPDLVIRQESYSDDVNELLKQMKLTPAQGETIYRAIAKKGLQKNSALHGLILTMFSRGLSQSRACFTRMDVAKRVWTALQIQGQVYSSCPFPEELLWNINDLTVGQVVDVLFERSREMAITAEESRTQRTRALVRAYKKIKPDLLIKIQAMYYYDFKIFDYDFHAPVCCVNPHTVYPSTYTSCWIREEC